LRLHTASRQISDQTPVRHALDEVLNDSDRVMSEGREMFLDVAEKHEGRERDLPEVIAGFCAEFATAYPIEYRVEVDGQPSSLNPLVATELGKIAREAIYNAFRHSKAKAIEVELTYGKREMRLRVRDNGQGFEPKPLEPDAGPLHLGLQNMRIRAEKLDAEFRLWSGIGNGTELEVTLAAQTAYSTTHKSSAFFGPSRHG
jgi:signal transduction histidine kinase